MDSKILRKKVLALLDDLAKEYAFIRYKPTTLLRETDNVLSSITFALKPFGSFHFDVAVQPLYVPREGLTLGIGGRLENFSASPVHFGDEKSEETLDGELQTVRDLLRSSALPWLATMGTPRGLIKCLTEPPQARLIPLHSYRDENIGLSYTYLKEYEPALFHLGREVDITSSDDRDWAIARRQILIDTISLIHENPGAVPERLKKHIAFTRSSLKLTGS